MKNKRIQTKRDAGKKSGFSVLHARTRGRKKQRAAMVGSAEDLAADVPNVSIGRALIVLLVLHVVAIIAVFAHTKFTQSGEQSGEQLTDQPAAKSENVTSVTKVHTPAPAVAPVAPAPVAPQPSPASQPAQPAHSILPTVVDAPTVNPLTQPAPSQQVDQPVKVRPGSFAFYTVQPGDSAWRIATKHKMKVDEFLKLNGKSSSKILVGEKVKVKK